MRSPRVKLAGLLFFCALPMLGQPARTFMSAATGDDLNPCSLTSPCRNLQRAINAVASSGEVVALDSGGYGVATISKSVTVAIPSGVYAGVTAFSTPGITIDTSGVVVNLRGLSINSLGGTAGVSVSAVPSVTLNISRAAISGFPAAGVTFNSAAGRLLVADSVIRDNLAGVDVESGDPQNLAHGELEHCQFSGNGGLSNGAVLAGEGSQVTVHDCVAHGNFRGFQVAANSTSAQLTVEHCAATGNAVGLFGSGPDDRALYAVMYVSDTLVAHNTLYAIETQTGSAIYTRGNNTVIDNAAAETFPSGTYAAK